MDRARRFGLILGLILLTSGSTAPVEADGPEEGWQVYTNANQVYALVLEGGGAMGGGYTWAGTSGGVVCRGDSERMVLTTLDGLADNDVTSIAVDGAGRWWFGTDGGGVSVLDDGGTPLDNSDDTWAAFITSDGLGSDVIRAAEVDSGGRLWFGTGDSGLSVLDDGGTPFVKGDDTWGAFSTSDGLGNDEVRAIAEDVGGRLWFGTYDGGVSVLDYGGTPFDKGDDNWTTFTNADGLGHNRVRAIAEDAGGRLWFGTSYGASVLDYGGTPFDKGDDTWITFSTSDGLLHDRVQAIVEDGGGWLWLGTNGGGVSVLDTGGTPFDKDDDTWVTFTTADGLAADIVHAVREDDAGRLWAGTYGGGMSVLDHGGTPFSKMDDVWTTLATNDGLVSNHVDAVAVESGIPWFATHFGVSLLDEAGTPFDKGDDTWTTFTAADGLASDDVNAIDVDAGGRLWFGTYSGVSVLESGGTPFDKGDDTWIIFTTGDGLGSDNVVAILDDGGGQLWFATYGGGASVLNDGGTPFDKGDDIWTTFTNADGLVDDYVSCIAAGNGGQMWFGTYGDGASLLDDGGTPFIKGDDTWASFTPADDLADSKVQAIEVDGAGRPWFGTSGGVSVLDDGGTPFSKADDSWITFTTADGLGHDDVDDIVVAASGRLWFGTDGGGLSILDNGGTPFDKGDDSWLTFTSVDGLVDNNVEVIALGTAGQWWLGSDGGGVGVLVDAVAPASSASSPDYANSPPAVSSFATDGASGVFGVGLWVKYGSDGTWADTGMSNRGQGASSFDYTPAHGDGVYYFATVAEDWGGNTETIPTGSGDDSTVYDTTVPASDASSSEFDNGGDISVGWTVVDATSGPRSTALWVKVGSGGSWVNTSLTQMGASGSFSYTPAQGEGTYYFATAATDNADNAESPPSGSGDDSTIYDTTSPSSTASSPCYDNGGDIAVSWASSDDRSGVGATALWVKYGSVGTWTDTGLTQTGSSGGFYYTPTQGDGTYFFATTSTDNAGNVEAHPTGLGDASTVFDTTAPSSRASSSDYDNGGDVAVAWSSSDAISGIDSTTLWAKFGSGGGWADTGLMQTGSSGSFDYTPRQGDGAYCFATVATDGAGNTEAVPTGSGDDSTVHDITAPTVDLASHVTTGGDGFQVTWMGGDATSGVASYDVQYRVGDSGTWQDWRMSTYGTSAEFGPDDPVGVVVGETYYFRARARDFAANVSGYASAENAVPTGSIYRTYIPLVPKQHTNYFEGPWEQEDNDSYLQANGPVRSGRDYYGYPDDQKDYYSVYLRSPGAITIDVINHAGQGVQLWLFYQSVANGVADDRSLTSPYQIQYSGAEGWYYVYIYTESGHNSDTAYTLRVEYPEN